MALFCERHLAKSDYLQAQLKATAASAEEFRFCGAASRVDEWIIILAYQVISDQRANVFNFMLPAWVRVFIVYGKLREWLVPPADSGNKNFTCDCEERLYLKVNMVIGHEMMHIQPKLSYTS